MRLQKAGLAAVALLVLVAAYGFFVQVFFLFHLIHGPAKFLANFVIVPAAIVRASDNAPRTSLSYRATVELARGAEAFSDVSAKEAFAAGLSSGVHRLYVEQIARELEVAVLPDEVATYVIDEQSITDGLAKAGWTIDDYRKYVVAPLLLAQKTEVAVYAKDEGQDPARDELSDLLAKVDEGIPFTDVAKFFSQDLATAKEYGSLGLMKSSEVPTWLLPAMNLEPEERSSILSAPDAYWVVELASEQTIGGEDFVRFVGIAVKKKSLGEIIEARRATHPPLVLVW